MHTHIWYLFYRRNPFAVHFSSIKVSDLVLVSPEGYVTEHGAQLPINMAGFHIHSAIHKVCPLPRSPSPPDQPNARDSETWRLSQARPEIQAAAHCHSLHGKAWSVFGKPIDILTQDSCLFYDNLSVYKNFRGIVLAPEEGKNIAEALGPENKTCILQNHGLLTRERRNSLFWLFYVRRNADGVLFLLLDDSTTPK